jgi:REP element-mobilizing transposase RayT
MRRDLLFKCDTSALPNRKLTRHRGWDYSAGDFFVTACTRGHRHALGFIQHDRMQLNGVGEALVRELETEAHLHYPYATILLWTVMPNHFHAIIRLRAEDESVSPCVGHSHSALSRVMGGLKMSVAKWAHNHGIPFEWQTGYHDHVIRNVEECRYIVDYIEQNVIHWAMDKFYEE